ncbi:MAG: Long-chain acyl-CoA synthetase [Syntrophus sp. SKADARSKE-3]|nr:Long-chain acyl-CoA synthetase [Syntrophus sp. SKADARSKE-3]
MERVWMKNWPDFISQESQYPRGKKPIFEYLRDNAREFPDRTAIVYYGKEVTYGELDRMSDQFARFLMDKGLKKGDRIALFLTSCPQYHIAHYGINKMGGVIVPCSPLFKEWELTYELRDTGARAIVALDLLYSVAAASCKDCGIETIVVTSMHDFLPAEPTMNLIPTMQFPKMTYPDTIEFMDILSKYPAEPVRVDVGLDDMVQLQFTGGTTGVPKGAILTHGNKLFKAGTLAYILNANMAYMGQTGSHSSCLAILPTFHIAGMLGAVDAMIAMWATQILMVMFDPVAAMQAIERYKINFFQAAVPMNIAIMNHPDRKKYDLSSLKLCLTTSFGIQLTDEIVNLWKEDTGGCMLAEAAYGLTETHTFDSFMPLHKPKYEAGCQGIPIPGQQIKIVSWEDKTKEVPIGEVGEIVLNNPGVFKGYWNKPEETANTLIDGWVYTGDMGKFDEDGYLYFLGRKKEMIKVSGFSVFPEEVETFLLQHEAVDKVAVIGAPDDKKGEVIKAFIIPKAIFKGKIQAEEIIAWAKAGISSYKVPQAIDFRDELPMSGVGKVLRRVLLEEEVNKGKK